MITLEFNPNRKQVLHCPCGKSNKDGKFSPYNGFVDKGYCHSCGEIFLPNIEHIKFDQFSKYEIIKKEVSFIEPELVKFSMINYERNIFFQWLESLFGSNTAIDLCELYKVGTSSHWEKRGANIFWYCDSQGKYRSGKIMLYDQEGHRLKKPFEHCNWVHKVAMLNKFHFVQCFFGEHLLSKPENADKAIVVVESEKTALVASVYFPNAVWIACGGSTGLTEAKCRVLKNRNIVLYPDLGKFDLWSCKAENLRSICASVKISDFLEMNVSEEDRKGGYDLADYLIRFPVSDCKKSSQQISYSGNGINRKMDEQNINDIAKVFEKTDWGDPSWSVPICNESELSEIEEIEKYFAGIELPKGKVHIKNWATTDNISSCIVQAISNAKQTAGNLHTGSECLERLRSIKVALSSLHTLSIE